MKAKIVSWFCLRSQLKHEQIAAAHLRKIDGVEVFLPLIRFKRATRRGASWVKEPLFPGYLFAAFEWQTSFREVQSAPGVKSIVHFGKNWPVIPDSTMEELRRLVGETELHTITQELAPGDSVRIADGTLRGLQAVVSRVMPGRERVAVLMDILGQQAMIELTATSIIREGDERVRIFEPKNDSPA